MPPSRSGRRRDSAENDSPRKMMPTPVMSQPISRAFDPATAAMFCGRLKMPEPIIELMTNAVRDNSPIWDLVDMVTG